MRRSRLVPFILAPLTLLAACGGGTSTPDATAGCQQIQAAYMSFYTRCYGSPADEQDAILGNATYYCNQIGSAVTASKIVYDGSQVSGCVSDIEGSSCTLTSVGSARCAKVFQGKLANGMPCNDPNECSSASCTTGTSSTGCPGVCAAQVLKGGDCSAGGAVCATGLSCFMDPTSGNLTCVTPVATGQSCASAPCAGGGYCDGSSSMCLADKGTGAACPNGNECQPNLSCAGSTSTSCQAPKPIGQSCTAGNGECAYGLFCNSGKCAEWPRTGGTCGVVGGELAICVDSYCSAHDLMTPGSCMALVAVTKPCDTSATQAPCASGAQCMGSGASGTCTAFACY